MKPGIHDLTNAEYHAAPGISKSGLDLINRSPAHYKFRKDNPDLFEETPSMKLGTLLHLMVLEPEKLPERYACMPQGMIMRGKNWEAFQAEHEGKEFLSANEWQEASLMSMAIIGNPTAAKLIELAASEWTIEESVFAEDFETGALCKCRPDLRVGSGLIDVKSTRSADQRSFSYSAKSFRYHVQAAYYIDVCREVGLDIEEAFTIIAVDNDARPYQCTVYGTLSEEAIEAGRQAYRNDLLKYVECERADIWPGYPETYDILTISGYAYDEGEL